MLGAHGNVEPPSCSAGPPARAMKGGRPMRVLVVEDFEVLARSIGTGLRREGMAVDVVLDGTDALAHLAITRYDVVVLDRDLPGVHGDDVCRRIVADRLDSRVLMLTAAEHRQRPRRRPRPRRRRLPAQAVRLRRAGRARPRARPPVHAGRCRRPSPTADLTLDPSRRVASRAGRRLELSPKEFAAPRVPARLARRPRRLGRGAARTGLGRGHRPVHHRRQDDHAPAARQARRPAVIHTVREGGYRIGDPR